MKWPSPQEYNEALQNPGQCFADEELQKGFIDTDLLGLPRPMTGAFASVYKVRCHDKDIAVRCFLSPLFDQKHRYAALSRFLTNDDLSFTVPFEFIEKGIKWQYEWYPILKMDWVEGLTLDQFVRVNLRKPEKLHWAAEEFLSAVTQMRSAGIAHGDLQHGNIMISEGSLFLVDYDGMYVPELTGQLSNELGHRDYQHPRRVPQDFGPEVDNFSAWTIYCSLKILANEPLALELLPEQESILFCRADFINPKDSILFRHLEYHDLLEVSRHAKLLRSMLKYTSMAVPPLERKTLETTREPNLKKLKPLGREDFVRQQSVAAMVVPREKLAISLQAADSSEVTRLLSSPEYKNKLPSPVSIDQQYQYGLAYLHDRVERMPPPRPVAARTRALLAFFFFYWPALFALTYLLLHQHATSNPEFFAGVVCFLLIAATAILSIIFVPIILMAHHDDRAEALHKLRKKCEKIRIAVDSNDKMEVLFYVIDRSNLGQRLPLIRVKPTVKPKEPLKDDFAVIRNWEELTYDQHAKLQKSDGALKGTMYFIADKMDPFLVVTEDNVPLWFV